MRRILATVVSMTLVASLAMAWNASSVSAQSSAPVGYLDRVITDGSRITVTGWAADPVSPQRDVYVDIYVDGDYAETTTTGGTRPDVAAAFPTYGTDTGYNATFGLSPGTHDVCAFAIDQDTLNTRLGCETVTIAPTPLPPIGYLDRVITDGSRITVTGWAADPVSPQRDVYVDIYVDGDYAETTTTGGTRPDVAAAFPTYGTDTGYEVVVDVLPGIHRICAFAIDQDTLNTRLGCETAWPTPIS
jgi:hypothetical protein